MRKFTLVFIVLLCLCGNALAWDGVNPLNYYYLKNVAQSKYIHARSSQINGQWFDITDFEDATPFTINKYNANSNDWPTIFAFTESNSTKWFGTNNGDKSEKKTELFEWDAVTNNANFQLQKSNRRLNACSASEISLPKTNGTETWIYWVVEASNDNNNVIDYYLYNVGQDAFLTNNSNMAAVSSDKDDAVKISINKFSASPLLFYGTNDYIYQYKGDASASTSSLDFNIYVANGGYYLYSVNGGEGTFSSDYRKRFLNASSNSGNCDFPYQKFTDNNRTWKFIPVSEYEGAKPKYQFSATANAYSIDLSEDDPADPAVGGGTVAVSFAADDNGATVDENISPAANTSVTASMTTHKLFATTSMSARPTYTAYPAEGYVFLGWSTSTSVADIVSPNNPYTPASSVSVSNSTMNTTVSNSATTLYALFSDQVVPVITIANEDDNNMKVGETISFDFGNTSATYPSLTGDFTYTITNNTPEGVTTGSAHPDKIIMFTADGDGNTLTACNAGTATITFHQNAVEVVDGFDIAEKEFVFEITVSKYTPSAFVQKVSTKPINSIITMSQFIEETGSDGAVTLSIDAANSQYAEIVDGKIFTYAPNAAIPVSVSQAETYMWSAPANVVFNLEITDLVWAWNPEVVNTAGVYYIYNSLYTTEGKFLYASTTDIAESGAARYLGVTANLTQATAFTMTATPGTGTKNGTIACNLDGTIRYIHFDGGNITLGNSTTISFSHRNGHAYVIKDGDSDVTWRRYLDIETNKKTVNLPEAGITCSMSSCDESNWWYFISQDQFNAKVQYDAAYDAIQSLIAANPDNVSAQELKTEMLTVLAANDCNSANSYSQRVTNLQEVVSNCNSFVAEATGEYMLTVSIAGWATVCLPFKADIPSGITAYYAKAATASSITLSPIGASSIAAEEPIIVSATPGNYLFETTSATPDKITANLLGGTLESTNFDENAVYVLAGVNATVPFFAPLIAETGASQAILPANKAYIDATLLVDPVGGAPGLVSLIIEDTNNATDVEAISADEQVQKVIRNGQILIIRDQETYDVMGRRIQ